MWFTKEKTHRDYFEELAPRWDYQQSPERFSRLTRQMSRLRQLWQTATSILDIGTGTGALLPMLRAYAPNARIVGLDLAERMLAYARLRVSGVSLTEGDVHRLPFRQATFKTVICHASFPHFTDQIRAIAEMRRILAQEGSLIILHEIGREQVNAIHESSASPIIQQDRLPPGSQMQTWLQRNGFEVIRVEDEADHYLAIGRVA